MSLRTKVIGALLLLLGGYCGFSYTVMQQIMSPAFVELEQDLLQAKLDSVRRALDDQLVALDEQASGWINAAGLARLSWLQALHERPGPGNVLLLIGPDGAIKAHQVTTADGWQPRLETVIQDDFIRKIKQLEAPAKGLVTTERALMLTAVRAATDSADKLVFGRFLGGDLIAKIGAAQGAGVELLGPNIARQASAEADSETDLFGYRSLDDLWGERLATLKVFMPRIITDLSEKTIEYSVLLLLAAGATVLVLMWLMLRSLLLVPLRELIRLVNTASQQAVGASLASADPGKLQRHKKLLNKLVPTRPLTKRNDEIGKLALSFSDLSERLKQSADRVWQLAYEDSLTGLPNRSMFFERIEETVKKARKNKKKFGLLFIDLDGFKRINDTLGHDAGDELLRIVAARLRGCVRKFDLVEQANRVSKQISTVARFGGDEFVLLLNEIRDPEGAVIVSKRIISALQEPIALSQGKYPIGASIGIAVYPQDGEQIDDLVRHADAAMYEAKRRGRNTYFLYSETQNSEVMQDLELENDLFESIKRDQLAVVYQPQIDVASSRMVGVEALLRWQHPEHGLVPPDRFIPMAEKNGFIEPLGAWVLEQACRQARQWYGLGIRNFRMAVNVSSKQIKTEFANLVEEILFRTDLGPDYLELELTETALIEANDEVLKALDRLRGRGVHIAIDDFGTGYSSLSRLRSLPVDAFKIDRSFMRDIETTPSSRAVATAIITLGRELGMGVVAEGVETEAVLNFLRQTGCSLAQGYFFAKPLPAVDATGMFEERHWGSPVAATA